MPAFRVLDKGPDEVALKVVVQLRIIKPAVDRHHLVNNIVLRKHRIIVYFLRLVLDPVFQHGRLVPAEIEEIECRLKQLLNIASLKLN